MSKTGPVVVTAAEKSREATRLRVAGHTYDEIAAMLGISHGGAYLAVSRELARIRKEAGEQAAEIREVELQRLDRMLLAVLPAAEGGDLQAIATTLRLQERRAHYLGLDAPRAAVVVDARPDTVRALMALVGGPSAHGTVIDMPADAADELPRNAESANARTALPAETTDGSLATGTALATDTIKRSLASKTPDGRRVVRRRRD